MGYQPILGALLINDVYWDPVLIRVAMNFNERL